jgi:hypothetical protein
MPKKKARFLVFSLNFSIISLLPHSTTLSARAPVSHPTACGHPVLAASLPATPTSSSRGAIASPTVASLTCPRDITALRLACPRTAHTSCSSAWSRFSSAPHVPSSAYPRQGRSSSPMGSWRMRLGRTSNDDYGAWTEISARKISTEVGWWSQLYWKASLWPDTGESTGEGHFSELKFPSSQNVKRSKSGTRIGLGTWVCTDSVGISLCLQRKLRIGRIWDLVFAYFSSGTENWQLFYNCCMLTEPARDALRQYSCCGILVYLSVLIPRQEMAHLPFCQRFRK